MKFGILYEHQIPQPWDAESEPCIYREALEQVELADRVCIDYAWEVEHHFLEEYSHSSTLEVFLAAYSQRTKRIRLAEVAVSRQMFADIQSPIARLWVPFAST